MPQEIGSNQIFKGVGLPREKVQKFLDIILNNQKRSDPPFDIFKKPAEPLGKPTIIHSGKNNLPQEVATERIAARYPYAASKVKNIYTGANFLNNRLDAYQQDDEQNPTGSRIVIGGREAPSEDMIRAYGLQGREHEINTLAFTDSAHTAAHELSHAVGTDDSSYPNAYDVGDAINYLYKDYGKDVNLPLKGSVYEGIGPTGSKKKK